MYQSVHIDFNFGIQLKCDTLHHFTQISHVTTDHFVLSDSGRTIQGVTLSESDFPIMIRNARKG
ncbi:hypothetical protein PT076_08910, partial [Erysipelothrix rhusiopathiae]|nr:hypothetical protein [Erysipelothrix rhusiopathiae]